MKTINVRLLVDDNVDGETLVEELLAARQFYQLHGAVELINDGFGRLGPSPRVRTRPNVQWQGQSVGL